MRPRLVHFKEPGARIPQHKVGGTSWHQCIRALLEKSYYWPQMQGEIEHMYGLV